MEALCTGCNYLIFVGLLLSWFQSVRARLLPSRAKNRMVGAASLLLLYQLLRVFAYRFATGPAERRCLYYLYFVPMTLVALMNDLHFWVYQPKIDLSAFAVETGAYTHMPAFYALYAWMILSFAAGLLLLFRETRSRARKALAYLIAVVSLWFGLFTVFALVFDGTTLPRMYNNPDIHIFGMLGVLGVCIRFHLIPHNASYADCFAALRTPALVTDEALRPVYRSGGALADAIDMAETIGVDVTLAGPVPQEDPGRSLLAAAIQECAANAVKHAGGSALSVRIRKEETCA